MKLSRLRETFIKPERRFGPAPFFALNDELDPDRLRWALRQFHDQGCAGIFMHARTGLELDYLSEPFWERIALIIEECRRLGLAAWIYDEFNWPSGVAGGKAIADRPDYLMPALDCLLIKVKAGAEIRHPDRAIAVFQPGHRVQDLSAEIRDGRFDPPPEFEGEVLIFFEDRVDDPNFATANAPWSPGAHGYLDLMNPEAVRAFMELTHHQYAARFQKHFGKTVPGLFTDEPQFYRGFPWTAKLPERFKAEQGYDLMERLYELALDRGGYRKLRADFYELVERMAAESFYDPVRAWCDEVGLIFTGHLGMEERLRELPVNHGGLYRPLKAMTMPGIDALGDGNSTAGKLVNMESPQFTARAAAAVSRLHSDGRVLCEAGGGAGWGSNLTRFKSQLDWLFASGVTFVNPHQSLLSVKGLRKRDFPTSHFVQEPWFELYRLHSESAARMSALATHGDPVLELALLFPVSALRAASRGRGRKQGETLKRLVMSFDSVMEFLVRHQRDFELVFEESLSGGLVKVEKGKLKAGRRKFQTLIIPPCELIHRDAALLLKQLLETGGKVLAFGDLPARDHEDREILSELLPAFREALKHGRAVQVPQQTATSREGLLAALDRLHHPSLDLECAFREQVVCREWRFEDGAACFIANLGQETGAAELCFKTFKDVLERWDPETGEDTEWPYQVGGDGRARVKLELGPLSSLVLVWREDKKAKRRPRVIDADLEILGLNATRLVGITDRAKSAVTLDDSVIELSGEPPPLPLAFKPEWKLVPERKNIFLIEPWRVKTSRVQNRPLEDMEREPFFSNRTRRVIRLGRLLTTIVQTLRPPERRYRTERYFEFADAERGNAIVSRVLGLDLDRLGLYQATDTLLRIADYLGLRTFMRNFPPLGAEYEASASFKVDYIPDDLHLVYEDLGVPVGFELNKKPLSIEPRPAEAWDPCCRALLVADLVRKGKNRIVMKGRQLAFPALPPNTHSIEPVALMGGFFAGRTGIEKPIAGPAAGGDWKERGYPFYSGPMMLRTTFHLPEHYLSWHLVLEFSEVRETVELTVNGRAAGVRIYPPFRFPVSGLVRAGENLVEARVLNTAANLFDRPRPSGIPGVMRIVPYQRFEIALGRENS